MGFRQSHKMSAIVEITRARAGVLHILATGRSEGSEQERRELLMAHHCECYRRIVLKSAARHARAGWIYRPGHDLCRKCRRSLVARQAVRTAVASGGGISRIGFGTEETNQSAHITPMRGG